MDESVHLSLERFTRMQDQIVDLKTVRLRDAKEMLEMCMSAIYQMGLKMPLQPIIDRVAKTIEQVACDWVMGFVTSQPAWVIRWEVKNNFVRITELIPKGPGHMGSLDPTKNPLAR